MIAVEKPALAFCKPILSFFKKKNHNNTFKQIIVDKIIKDYSFDWSRSHSIFLEISLTSLFGQTLNTKYSRTQLDRTWIPRNHEFLELIFFTLLFSLYFLVILLFQLTNSNLYQKFSSFQLVLCERQKMCLFKNLTDHDIKKVCHHISRP